MSDAYEVVGLGIDTSGRTVLVNRRMKAAYDAVVAELGFEPTILQGAYMNRAGGADSTSGCHDGGGCIDTRAWDVDSDVERRLIQVARSVGWVVWHRDASHGGWPDHLHWVLLGDAQAAPSAIWQMAEYRAGRDGLDTQGADYHWRPDPIPTFDYDAYLRGEPPA
jgi:hypothetical protein